MKILRPLKSIVQKAFKLYPIAFLKLLTYPKKNDTHSNVIALIPPTTDGSFGDEAMLVGTINKLQKEGNKVIVISGDGLASEKLETYGITVPEKKIHNIYDNPLKLIIFSKLLKELKVEKCLVIGADVMDGYYSEIRSLMRMSLLYIASSNGIESKLLGFSYNKEPLTSCTSLLRVLSRKGVSIQPRDPVSATRLSSAGVKNTPVSDLAFMMEPIVEPTAVKAIEDFNDIEGNRELKTVTINLNAIHVQKYGKDFYNTALILIKHILNTSNKIIFITHDHRDFDGLSDMIFAKKITNELSSDSARKVLLLDGAYNAAHLKYVASLSDYVVTGRMHFAIGSLGRGVPPMMFGYQGKQEGLLQHFNLEKSDLILEPFDSDITMIEKFDNYVENILALRTKVKTNLDHVITLSESNL
jgi:polysaccharide pyruvyl transferase WcaK-like protein